MSDPDPNRADRLAALHKALQERILILDGPAGTFIQDYELDESGYRSERFSNWCCDVKGNNDLLILSQPEIITKMHEAYLEAGADIIETNTFSATTIAQADYEMEGLVDELNYEGARLARVAADAASTPEKPRFVAGAMGPTNRTASISPDVNDPSKRNVEFDELAEDYANAGLALMRGGVDIILIETIFDTLNAKAAIYGLQKLFDEVGYSVPLILSVTITDQSGRTLSGQTTEGFWNAVRHAKPIAVGINCALGPDLMRPYVSEMSRIADTYVSAYPNAGLPNAFGGYDETPESMTKHMLEWAEAGLVNIVGGCCGTSPAHINAFAEALDGVPPRIPVAQEPVLRLSGLEPFAVG